MSLTLSTLLIFLVLLPGLVFRFSLFHDSIVKRVWDTSGAIYSVLTVVFFAAAIHIILYSVSALMLQVAAYYNINLDWKIFGFDPLILQINGQNEELGVYVLNNLRLPIFYTIISTIAAWGLAWLVFWASGHSDFVSRLLYGPLFRILRTDNVAVLTCFVLTSISYGNKRMLYAGFPREVGLRDGSKIDYVVLENPTRFYLKLNPSVPKSTLEDANPISAESPLAAGFLFIAGSEIENVHFEAWYLQAVDDSS